MYSILLSEYSTPAPPRAPFMKSRHMTYAFRTGTGPGPQPRPKLLRPPPPRRWARVPPSPLLSWLLLLLFFGRFLRGEISRKFWIFFLSSARSLFRQTGLPFRFDWMSSIIRRFRGGCTTRNRCCLTVRDAFSTSSTTNFDSMRQGERTRPPAPTPAAPTSSQAPTAAGSDSSVSTRVRCLAAADFDSEKNITRWIGFASSTLGSKVRKHFDTRRWPQPRALVPPSPPLFGFPSHTPSSPMSPPTRFHPACGTLAPTCAILSTPMPAADIVPYDRLGGGRLPGRVLHAGPVGRRRPRGPLRPANLVRAHRERRQRGGRRGDLGGPDSVRGGFHGRRRSGSSGGGGVVHRLTLSGEPASGAAQAAFRGLLTRRPGGAVRPPPPPSREGAKDVRTFEGVGLLLRSSASPRAPAVQGGTPRSSLYRGRRAVSLSCPPRSLSINMHVVSSFPPGLVSARLDWRRQTRVARLAVRAPIELPSECMDGGPPQGGSDLPDGTRDRSNDSVFVRFCRMNAENWETLG